MTKGSHRCFLIGVLLTVSQNLVAAPSIGGDFKPGEVHTGIASRSDPSQTYTLYLPQAAADATPRPALLILDPRGRSETAAEIFRTAADRFGWILISSDNTRSDGPMAPNHRALAALWPELNSGRWPINRQRIYAAGFSGGAHFSWMLGNRTKGLAGVIACGGRHLPDLLEGTTFSHFGAAGTTDFNNLGMRLVDEQLADQGISHRIAFFDGPHRWMPQDLATFAVSWMEVDAIKRGLRENDDVLIDSVMTEDVERAQADIDRGRLLDAQRRYEAIAETFEGLRDVSAIRRKASELLRDPRVRTALKEERRLVQFEERAVAAMFSACIALKESQVPFPTGRFENDLQLQLLEKMAKADSQAGLTARRILATTFTQTSFYLTQDLMAAKKYEKAVVALTAATRINPDAPLPWYNLACAHARLKNENKALDALETSIVTGFTDSQVLMSDPDLASLHNSERFREMNDAIGVDPVPVRPEP